MTNHWNDLQYTDCALIMGANPAENHPISFRWLTKAREKGAKIVSVDPRYTRSSAMSDVYAPLRSGTDIAFLAGMINYAIDNNLIHKEYVAKYTNASFILKDSYEFNDGLFSGYDEAKRIYDKTKWAFETDEEGKPVKDLTLEHPRSVFQMMRKHYSRYTIDKIVETTGTPKEDFLKVCEAFCSTGKVGKSGVIMYAMGITQHTVGSQNVRAMAMLQLLLGNVGVPGGGLAAMRGESNVQGSTDFALLYGDLPGYVGVPKATVPEHATLAGYNEKETPKTGYWSNKPKFMVSMLKAWYGPNATKENEFCYQYLPKGNKNYSHINLFNAMYNKGIDGLFLFGTNPVVGGPNAGKEKESLANLKWLVAVDLWETESSAFWKKEAGADPNKIATEVFLLPASASFEKEGSVSNSSRWMQYRWKAIDSRGEAKADLEIIHEFATRIKALYKNENSPIARPINALYWNFGEGSHPDIDLVCKEINGYDLTTGKLLPGFGKLMDDGTTSSGNWIYSGFYPEEGKNRAKNRDAKTGGPNFLNWSYAWPMNRRIIYNRASADPQGAPWSKDKEVIHWDALQSKWVGNDVPDFVVDKAPSDPGGQNPYIMLKDGVAGIFAGLNEGPFPEHYEPFESPISNVFSKQNLNPAVQIFEGDFNLKGDNKDFPIVATTYRVSEHWQSGSMTRNQEWLSELVGHMFVEISEELAKEKGIKNKDKVIVTSARGEVEAYAMVTKRFKPYKIKGKKVHQIGMPWHFGYKGYATGDSANHLTPHIGDANTTIPEYKAFLCDVRRKG
ncbi:formate dehydrogenase-N subunit alpha [Neobacillus piezotolerans]|uniref:Formate dehydrogenase-N subunit alpha n=2 Tax=Neobacillus piezotolerans TaxID=2259171 RepID=A0A3D8GT42_9BACI|nr:formate dehydrogenase-N subunit alpha [Neobacillus piezotolerans]